MRSVMVRYRVKPERAAENEELVRGVYEELARVAPADFRYATYVLEDGVSFVHVASGEFSLPELDAFRRFRDGFGERADEQPVTAPLREVGSYGWR